MKEYWVYILTSRNDKVMYVGVTNDLVRRMHERRAGVVGGFTTKYSVDRLVYFEHCNSVEAAIAREKQIKGWRREKKNALVQAANPCWCDLAEEWFPADPSSLRSSG